MALVAITAISCWTTLGREPRPPALGSLVVATVAGYVVAERWGCWRWLAGLAVVPAWLNLYLSADLDWLGSSAVAGASVAVAVVSWTSDPQPAIWVIGAATLLGSVAVVSRAMAISGGGLWEHITLVICLAFCVAIAALAVGGRGRARAVRPVRWVCLVALLAPIPFVPFDAHAAVVAVTWWPTAAAIGLTALLRGDRGRSAGRAQMDQVDEVARAAFEDRYPDRRLAPVTVVIAAYNEADGLAPVLASLPSEVCGLSVDVLVVDDGSTDGTSESLAGSDAFVASCPINRGQGAALRLGYLLAREHGARCIVTTDADGQYEAADIPRVVAPILAGEADFVSGSRILGHQHSFDKVRRAGVHVFAWLATVLTGQRLTDTSFGLRAMRAEATAAVSLSQPQYQSSELLLGVISRGFRVREVPATMHLRSSGTTKKGRNLKYGSSYARAMVGTWLREGCPRPVSECATALRPPLKRQSGTTATPMTD